MAPLNSIMGLYHLWIDKDAVPFIITRGISLKFIYKNKASRNKRTLVFI